MHVQQNAYLQEGSYTEKINQKINLTKTKLFNRLLSILIVLCQKFQTKILIYTYIKNIFKYIFFYEIKSICNFILHLILYLIFNSIDFYTVNTYIILQQHFVDPIY